MARRFYSSTAARTTLAAGVDGSQTTMSVTAVSGWPTSFPYTLVIDQDTVNEELVEVTGRTGTTITVTRGIDGTSGTSHDAGAVVQHGVSARDFDEPNAFINGTGTVTETLLASGAVTEAKLGTGAVTSAKILDGTIVNADINASAAIAQSKIADLTSDLASKVDYALPVNAQTGTTYTFVLADAEKLTTASNASPVTLTIPPQSSVTWADNTILRVVNYGAGAVTVDGGSGVTVTNAATTIRQYSGASLVRTGSNAWTVVPFGGSASAVFNEGSSSGATFSTLTNPDSDGLNYRLASFTTVGSHSLVISSPGYVQFLLASGGGSGGLNLNGYSGGGGAAVIAAELFLAAGTYPVVIGAGGAAVANGQNGNHGNNSTAFGITAPRGGGGTRIDGPVAGPSGGWYNQSGASNPVTSKITGSNVTYGNAVGAGVAGANGLLYVRTVV